ncbi:MAG: adenosylcobinamide-GDP ribazoletransferase [Pseudomonadales bacterium]|nr:adenosylcobinamide-GDP ribazoletransferase [Pseudomonadales bacterium]
MNETSTTSDDGSARNQLITSLRLAFGFMTIIPVGSGTVFSAQELVRSARWFPLVGLVLGGACVLFVQILPLSLQLTAALLLLLSVVLTGALHIDGLADCADAWVGGHADRDRTLQIMKDPHSGPMAVVAVTTLLLVKYALYVEVLEQQLLSLLLLAPMLSRTGVVWLMGFTPYVGNGMLGGVQYSQAKRHIFVGLSFGVTVAVLILPEVRVIVLLVGVAAIQYVLQRVFLRKLNGFTGDCAGASIEITELSVMLLGILALT